MAIPPKKCGPVNAGPLAVGSSVFHFTGFGGQQAIDFGTTKPFSMSSVSAVTPGTTSKKSLILRGTVSDLTALVTVGKPAERNVLLGWLSTYGTVGTLMEGLHRMIFLTVSLRHI